MANIEWNDTLSIGIELIDKQHQALIEKLNDVARAVHERQGEREIIRTLGFLTDYTAFHFSAEEARMEQTEYAGLEQQRASHQKFVSTLADLKQDFREEGATTALADCLNTFLFNWLTKHIRGLDHQFGDFLREQEIDISE